MRILLAIVHYWDPDGGGKHQSLRPNPDPRINALKEQLLSLQRLGPAQAYLHMADRKVYPANEVLRHEIDIRIITDGTHHVLNSLPENFQKLIKEIKSSPKEPKALGFEAHKYLASQLDEDYDIYGYLEDDLIIHDPTFFHKIFWFSDFMGESNIILPQRYELNNYPHIVDRFYIDGPIDEKELRLLVPKSSPVFTIPGHCYRLAFESPLNPHSGCFFLTKQQLSSWIEKSHWLDYDYSFISPLESAATLGIAKTFNLFKPCLSTASWLEIQHYGTNFHSLITENDS